MAAPTILILAEPGLPQLAILESLKSRADIHVGDRLAAFSPEALRQAEILFAWGSPQPLTSEVFNAAPDLKWVHSRSAGLDKLLFPELVASPVPLTNGTGVFSASLGEFALAVILYFAKDFRRMIRQQTAHLWQPFDVEPIAGKTVGIVGYGDIGRAVASRVHAMGMKVLAAKRNLPSAHSDSPRDPWIDAFYPTEERAAMIAQCDYIVVAAPLTKQTRSLIGNAEFAAMKSTAVIINIGRGPVIDEAAMIAALTPQGSSGSRIRGAGLDVVDEEPLPAGSPLYSLENVLLSPHCADNTPDWMDNAMHFFVEQFERFETGAPLKNIVDKKRGY